MKNLLLGIKREICKFTRVGLCTQLCKFSVNEKSNMKGNHLIYSKFSHFNHSHSQSYGLTLHHIQQRATSRARTRTCLVLCSVLQLFRYDLSNHQKECYIDEMPAPSFAIEPITKAGTSQTSVVPGASQHLSSSKGTICSQGWKVSLLSSGPMSPGKFSATVQKGYNTPQ